MVSRYRRDIEINDDGSEKHIFCEGARFHVVSWDKRGPRCSEPNCEINRYRTAAPKEQPNG